MSPLVVRLSVRVHFLEGRPLRHSSVPLREPLKRSNLLLKGRAGVWRSVRVSKVRLQYDSQTFRRHHYVHHYNVIRSGMRAVTSVPLLHSITVRCLVLLLLYAVVETLFAPMLNQLFQSVHFHHHARYGKVCNCLEMPQDGEKALLLSKQSSPNHFNNSLAPRCHKCRQSEIWHKKWI